MHSWPCHLGVFSFFFQQVCSLFHGTGIPHTFSFLAGVFMFGGVYFTLRCLCLGGPLAGWARVADLSSVQFFITVEDGWDTLLFGQANTWQLTFWALETPPS